MEAIRDTNLQHDEISLTYAHKATIMMGMAQNVNGLWHVKPLTSELQQIVKENKELLDEVANIGSVASKACTECDISAI